MSKSFQFRYLFLLFLLIIGACSSENSDKSSILFTSDNPNPGENAIFLIQESVTETSINLALMCSTINLDRVYGIAFDLSYDPSIFTYSGIKPGTWLEDGGLVTVNYLAAHQSNDNKRLVVGISQQGNAAGRGGQGKIAEIKFHVKGEGTSQLSFSNTAAKNQQLDTINGITWIGGSLRSER